ncbi:PAS domain S-box-containing protein/diguanylate cyclase (GGDEF)-like protein [Motilibacter peucedani]|uniref:PAS domain S-box-containing protein/diguanylate cyclase (GGDEF)-like protein n=1 Tax=Motilibacter peucedani TaxID=598650 RepID=A0A420XMH7_9ACTN|nr:EAL domain-containing protein [Motilibacter peucedani]RKS72475.1 PAS domain S-box-containing protein/diguanylate cyclase (GGDEF)-like protein [Motilibacter peucedani]
MTRKPRRDDSLDLRGLASRCGAVLTLAGSAVSVSCTLPLGGWALVAGVSVAVVAAAVGVLCLVLPFHRWPRAAMLPIIPLGCVMIGLMNAVSFNPYNSTCFFTVLAVFIGLSQPRWTSLWWSPLIGVAFWLPLADVAPADHAAWLRGGALDTVLVCVLLSEITAYLVSRLTRSAAQLHEHDERRFASLVENSSDITVLLDGEGRVEYVSPSLTSVLGIEASGLVGAECAAVLREHMHPDEVEAALERLAAGPRPGVPTQLDLRVRGGDGWRVLECTLSASPDSSGAVINARDVTERHRLEVEVREQALRNPVTGLPNRTLLNERIWDATGAGTPVGVIHCDIDGFKTINDRLGREGGDAVLSEVAGRLYALVAEPSLVAHLEGDEFAVLLVGAGEQETESFALRVLECLRAPFDQPELVHTLVTASLGLAGSWTQGADPVTDADLAMYAAKAAGGDCARVFEPDLREARMGELVLRESVRQALHGGELRLHFQPIVDVASARLQGLEALIRWEHPTRGLLGPFAFLPTAESMGLMGEVDRWVLRTACASVAELKREHPVAADAYVSANVSPARLEEPGFADEVRAVLADTGLDPRHLVLEITESAALGLESVVDAVRVLRAIGVRFAVDDFGTGYSSLSYLQQLDFDILKVDKSFTDHITTERSSTRLVSVIAELGRTLGLHTVVEGVETEVQARALHGLGVPSAQGYLYSRPMSPADLPAVIEQLEQHAPLAAATA